MKEKTNMLLRFALIWCCLSSSVVTGSKIGDGIAESLVNVTDIVPHIRHSKSNKKRHDRFIVKYKNRNGRNSVLKAAKKIHYDFHSDQYVTLDLDVHDLKLLKSDANIESIERDSVWTEEGIFEQIIDDPKEFFSKPENQHRHLQEQIPYGIVMVQADKVSVGKYPTRVCVVDTGVLASHPDLDISLLSGADRISSVDGTLSQWDVDTRGHGTHVTGTINARANNNYGVRGIGRIPVYMTRGLNDEGKAFESDIRDAIGQCEAAGVKIISLSLSGSSMTTMLRDQLDRLYNKNILIVAASGNGGFNSSNYPAAYNKVVSVGAVNKYEDMWVGSNYGPTIELTAPGDGIISTGFTWKGEYKLSIYSGTSMAVPHVAGSAAILWSYYPECTVTQIRYALAYSAKDKNTTGCDQYFGYGIVQIKAALNFLSFYPCRNANWGKNVGDGTCSAVDTRPNNRKKKKH